jgi:hypothetical protein
MNDLKEHTVEYEAYLIKLAETNIAKGVIEEPRIYTETFFTNGEDIEEAQADSLTFVNGEKFPVRILYMTANCTAGQGEGSLPAAGVFGERAIQTIGLRMRFHDQFYMRPQFTRLPNWSTHVVASSDANSPFTSSHKTWRPVVLSARDSFQVQVKPTGGLLSIPDPSEDVPWQFTTTFTGVGIFSKRPYILSSKKQLVDLTTVQLDVADFKNDGAEPILITDVTHNAVAILENAPVVPVLPFVSVGVKQIGNGTNADWVVSKPGVGNLAAAPVWGSYSGRALVHRFPGQGLIWEPGEGIEITVNQELPQALQPLPTFTNIALVGYIAIQ